MLSLDSFKTFLSLPPDSALLVLFSTPSAAFLLFINLLFLEVHDFQIVNLEGRGNIGRSMGSVEGESWALFLRLYIGFLCKISLEEKGSNVKKHLKIYVALKFPIKTHLFPGVVPFFTKPFSSTLTFPSTLDTVLLGVMHLLTYCLALYF